MKGTVVASVILATGAVCSASSASECLKAKSDACGYYEYMASKTMLDFKAALSVCVESSRDTTDAFNLDVGADYYKACRASLQGMVNWANDRILEYDGCVSKFRC